ncbi:PQQ-binding-like beta-propeller repeat protein [Brevibacillus sp. SYSU BS000544]|uniref:outer membrane protein assembly factor BamB family protein n=1 Tax=Brevibacillus sp. SYSU BS000544 TaxID=3416443 RepID=UPI003CE4AD28
MGIRFPFTLSLIAFAFLLLSVFPTQGYAETKPPVKWTYKLSVNDPDVQEGEYIPVWKSIEQLNENIYITFTYKNPRTALQVIGVDGKKKWDIIANTSGKYHFTSTPDTDGAVYVYTKEMSEFQKYDSKGSMAWSMPLTNGTFPSKAVIGSKGLVYIMHEIVPDVFELVAVDKKTGKTAWKYEPVSYRSFSAEEQLVIGPDGTIYMWITPNTLSAIRYDGKVKWTKNINAFILSTPIFDKKGNLYLFTSKGISALDKEGEKIWTYQPKDGHFFHMARGEDGTLFLKYENKIHAVKPDGKFKWEYTLKQDEDKAERQFVGVPLAGKDGSLYVLAEGDRSTEPYYLYAIDKNGKEKWVSELQGDFSGFFVFPMDTKIQIDKDGILYVPIRNKIFAVTPKGKEEWTLEYDRDDFAGPIIGADSSVYIGYENKLTAIKKGKKSK